jgi:hypothetical protein
MSPHYLFDRKLWEKEYFTDKNPYGWRCSKCGISHLKTNIETKLFRSSEGKNFAAMMRCSNPDCNTAFAVAGLWGKFNRFGGELSIKDQLPDTRRFFPKLIEPPIALFTCDSLVPSLLMQRLDQAFQLFWVSSSACANAIRLVLECLMDCQNISRADKESLHSRLDRFKKSNNINGERLLAVKWIGNEGSHDVNLERSDLLDGFELLATVFSELYPDINKNERLDFMTSKINSTKKPRSKNK